MRLLSVASLSSFMIILFMIGFAPNLTQDAFAASGITSAVANDPDDADAVYSVGDTIVITFPAAVNGTFASGTMNNVEFRANFTVSSSDIDTADTVSGVWNAGATALTVTIDTIAGSTPPVINTDTFAYDTTNGNIGYGTNSTHFIGTAVTLTGDFGLFFAATTSSGCERDCKEPTLGLDNNGRRMVDNGFSYNGKSVDVERYFTPYPLVTVKIGKQNVAEFKIYENMGPDKISHFELAFGLANGESIGMSKAVINWDKTFDGIETVTLDDPENVLDKVRVTTSEGNCSDELQQKCLIVKVVHTFRAPLDFNMLGTNVWDTKRNAWQNYYNHGIEVVGESLNPPKEYDGIDKRQIYHLTETGKNTAVDEFGNSWSLKYGLWEKDYIPNVKNIDGFKQDRSNALFNFYKQGQELLAKEVLEKYCPSCSDKEFAEIDDIFSYEFPKQIDKLSDPEIQNKMLQESLIAENTLKQIFDSIYPNFHF